MSRELPLVVTAAWWFHGWLGGRASADEVLEHLGRHSPVHTLAGSIARATPGAGDGLVDALATLQLSGASGVACALPVPGDPAGLRGPADLNREATEAGGLLLGLGSDLALVPDTVGQGTAWHVRRANPRPPGDLGEADRRLRSVLIEAADRLAALEVASWSPDAVDEVLNLHHTEELEVPANVPPRAAALAERSLRLLRVVDVAYEDGTGGAVSAHEAMARQDALDDLERAARHALQAAASPDAWPEH